MDRITGTAVVDLGNGKRGFQDQILSTGGGSQEGTVVTAKWLNSVQEELLNVIVQSGQLPDDGDLTQLSKAIAEMIRNTVPPGTGSTWYTNEPPAGWLECDGALISRTAYAGLFAAIGTTFGGGDGATTFKLPDLRGEFLRGWDHGRGVDAGRAFGSFQKGTLVGGYDDNVDGANGSIVQGKSEGAEIGADPVYPGQYTQTVTVYGSSDPTVVFANMNSWYAVTRPRNIAPMFIIKY
ncbi:phage tail protein [Martelella endophytica]|uniref:phage tail protein n=1 Tax=Martelella endophytica TaxID=1486262 RepID=UPI0006962593|nr:tail fiber protein [Martelella endophytica]